MASSDTYLSEYTSGLASLPPETLDLICAHLCLQCNRPCDVDAPYSFQKISLADFVKWNPTVGPDCNGMWAEVNVCVGVIASTATTLTTKTATNAGSGVSTPQPTQPGMVTNCVKFRWVAKSVTCYQIYSFQKISLADFLSASTPVSAPNVPACSPRSTSASASSVATRRPLSPHTTPTLIQPGMVTNCKKFHWVANGVTYNQIYCFNKISLVNCVKWNSGVGAD